MKITCEHCGTGIDTEKDRNCPHCGAPYSKNKEYKEAKDYKKKHEDFDLKERETNIHSKELQNQVMEHTLNSFKSVSIVSKIVPIIAFLIFAGGAFFIFKEVSSVSEQREEKEENKYQTVAFNENGVTDAYEMKCDGIEEYKYDSVFNHDKDEETTTYSFHMVFKNKTDNFKDLDSIILTYTDDKGNEDVLAKREIMTFSSDTLVSVATEKATYTGNVIFKIPNYVTDVKIKYQFITIDIKDFKNKIITE